MRARFVVCGNTRCCEGLHGYIEMRDGGSTREVCSQHEALAMLARLVGKGIISTPEIAGIMLDIGRARMQFDDDEVDPAIRARVEEANIARVVTILNSVEAFFRLALPGKSRIH